MVKNTHGGSGHKKFARKHTSGAKSNKLRISEDEGEIYAIVTKMLGNGMFHCHCIDGTIRLGHIRGKFTGRGKRDNLVESGKWLLIGLREWDLPSEKSCSISKGKGKKCSNVIYWKFIMIVISNDLKKLYQKTGEFLIVTTFLKQVTANRH